MARDSNAKQLPVGNDTQRDALAAVVAISGDWRRASALAELAPDLPETLLPDALAAACAISDGSDRAYALAALAPHLPETLLPTALAAELAAVVAISTGSDRARALAKLAPRLPDTLLPDALAVIKTITGDSDREHALTRLAPHLPGTLLPDALAATKTISDDLYRSRALAALVPHLPEALFPDALAAARAISTGSDRESALTALAPHLPEALFPDALAAAKAISSEISRAYALAALAPHLPEALFPDALAAARAISKGYDRARALDAINAAVKIAGKKKEPGGPLKREVDPDDLVAIPPEKINNTDDLSRTDTELLAPSAEKDFDPMLPEGFEQAQGEATAPTVARVLQWPTEKWVKSDEKLFRKQHGLIAFLRRVWKPFIDENNLLVTRAMLAERDPDAAVALTEYVRSNPLPDDIRIVRTRDVKKLQSTNTALLFVNQPR